MRHLSRWRSVALLILIVTLIASAPIPATCSTYNNCLNCIETCTQRFAHCIASATTPLSENNCYRADAACRLRCVAVVCTP
jgi:hypothetical protein